MEPDKHYTATKMTEEVLSKLRENDCQQKCKTVYIGYILCKGWGMSILSYLVVFA